MAPGGIRTANESLALPVGLGVGLGIPLLIALIVIVILIIIICTVKTGLLQPHFRLSQLHQCDQGMLLNRFFWNSSEVFHLELTTISDDIFDYIPGISTPQPSNKGTPSDCKLKANTKPY